MRNTSYHANVNATTRNWPFSVLGTRYWYWDYGYRDLRRRYAISPGISGHYQDLGISIEKEVICVVVLRLAWTQMIAVLNAHALLSSTASTGLSI